MGKSITPRYVIELVYQGGIMTFAWEGRPTNKKAEEARQAWNASFGRPDGSNWHITKGMPYVPHFRYVTVRENRPGGRIVARAKAPAFEVV